jgi:cytidylate kinase
MKTKGRSVEQIIEEQVKQWQLRKAEKKKEDIFPVITISREPGSGGAKIAEELAKNLDYDLYHQEVIYKIAESSKVRGTLLETLDEKALNFVENWIASLVNNNHLWPDQYLHHLMKVVSTIGRHGRAVILGRGANFILPPEQKFAIRIIAPLDIRIKNVSQEFGVSKDDAKKRIVRTDSDRRAYIRKHFHGEIANPLNYNLLINTGLMSIEAAIAAVYNSVIIK